MVCIDVFLVLLPEEHPLWIDLASSVALAIIMGLRNDGVAQRRSAHTVQCGETCRGADRLGARPPQLCEGAISPAFFQQIVGVLPVLRPTLGIEFNYFRRTLTDAGQRAATAATVTVLAVGHVGALSTLPWDGQGCGHAPSSWHEYFAFLFAVQGIFTGLATLVWLLVSSTPDVAANVRSEAS